MKSSKRPLHDLVQVLVRRSCGRPVIPCVKILKIFCNRGACMTVPFGMLIGGSCMKILHDFLCKRIFLDDLVKFS